MMVVNGGNLDSKKENSIEKNTIIKFVALSRMESGPE